MVSRRKLSLVVGITLVAVVMVFMAVSPVFAQNGPQVTVLPQQLERISWSAIIASGHSGRTRTGSCDPSGPFTRKLRRLQPCFSFSGVA